MIQGATKPRGRVGRGSGTVRGAGDEERGAAAMMSHGQSYFVDNDKDAVRKAMLEVRPVCGTHARADGIHPVRPAPLNYSGGSEAGGPAFSRPQGGCVYGAEGPSPPGARARGPPACSGAAWPTRRCASTRGRRRAARCRAARCRAAASPRA